MPNEAPVIDDELLSQAEADTSTEVGEGYDPDVDAEVDYNPAPPPLPDGWYLAKLTNLGRKVEDVPREFEGPRPWGANVTTYYTRVLASVVDPDGPQNNKQATGNVTTHNEKTPQGINRGSSAMMYYRAITGQPLPGVGQGAHIAAVAKELRSEPLVYVRTQLEGSDQDEQESYKERKAAGMLSPGEKKPKVYRQKDFMKNGILLGKLVLPNGKTITPRPVIQEVKPQSWTPPGK